MQASIWSTYNQTVADMNNTANVQYYSTLGEINAIQASSMDPSDMGAYNMTMYGMAGIHDIQSRIVGPLSQLKDLSDKAMTGQVAQTVSSYGTYSVDANSASALVTNLAGGFLPVHDILYALLFIAIGIAIATLFYYRKEILS